MRESTPPGAPVRREKDGRSWRIGTQIDVDWTLDGTETGRTITSGIPPVFEAYATVVLPDRDENRRLADELLLGLLAEESDAQPWWLDYLDVGADDVIFPDVPMVTLYADWQYVLVEAGRPQAANWRNDNAWKGKLPDLVFPADRSWLLSTLWDDDWRCLGGSRHLVQRILDQPGLDAREVSLGLDATPPGHVSR